MGWWVRGCPLLFGKFEGGEDLIKQAAIGIGSFFPKKVINSSIEIGTGTIMKSGVVRSTGVTWREPSTDYGGSAADTAFSNCEDWRATTLLFYKSVYTQFFIALKDFDLHLGWFHLGKSLR